MVLNCNPQPHHIAIVVWFEIMQPSTLETASDKFTNISYFCQNSNFRTQNSIYFWKVLKLSVFQRCISNSSRSKFTLQWPQCASQSCSNRNDRNRNTHNRYRIRNLTHAGTHRNPIWLNNYVLSQTNAASLNQKGSKQKKVFISKSNNDYEKRISNPEELLQSVT